MKEGGEFVIKDYFIVSKGKRFTSLDRGKNIGKFPYISSTAIDNGFSGYVNNFTHEGKLLTVVCYGEPAVTTYHEGKIWVSDSVNVLLPKFKDFNIYIGLFLKTMIEKNKFLFNYNRGLTLERLENLKVRLPKTDKGEPDWQFMENYIKSLDKLGALQKEDWQAPIINKKINFKDKKFKSFIYEDIFIIKKGQRIVNNQLKKGKVRCIRPIDKNNGVYAFIDIKPNHKAKSITVNYNGSVGEAFYQDEDYFALDDINVLYPNKEKHPKFELNPFIAIFLITLIKKEKYRFNYGRKWHKERMEKSSIILPIDDKGEPDWQFMEDYIKSLKYSSGLAKVSN